MLWIIVERDSALEAAVVRPNVSSVLVHKISLGQT